MGRQPGETCDTGNKHTLAGLFKLFIGKLSVIELCCVRLGAEPQAGRALPKKGSGQDRGGRLAAAAVASPERCSAHASPTPRALWRGVVFYPKPTRVHAHPGKEKQACRESVPARVRA